MIGDSIMAGAFVSAGQNPVSVANAQLAADGYPITLHNSAQSGSASGQWTVGDPTGYLAAALAAGAAMSPPADVAIINLGINNARSPGRTDPAVFLSTIQNTIAGLRAAGYKKIILTDYWYIAPTGAYDGILIWDSTAASLLAAYMTDLAGLDNGTTIKYMPGLYRWSSNNFTDAFTVPTTGHPNAAADGPNDRHESQGERVSWCRDQSAVSPLLLA